MARIDIRLSGSGGQGMITSGAILGIAAVYDGKNAVQTKSYGPEARGGAARAEVVISEEEINYVKVIDADILVALTQEAADKFSSAVKEGGIVIIDELMVKNPPEGNFKVYTLPIIKTAAEKVGKSLVANIVTLGALNEISNIVSFESLEKAVLSKVPKGTEELNKKALAAGREIAKAVL
ncbi:2-oxoacid:ferredoxin oxidoreductase subunit gamma [Deferribacter autotrophicus]|uniref:2-oxoacid:ferredoxin oxidoreductase subunit gamma n=1 Tax=Deferribacter autotrophicus TaxID=500465 RepID=A0A5A8F7N4_9BACT|nr:2-oxoacid:acceptor oxidoreductase family protein [Deferribacter autotrophicus]KAA0257938.1 2-oxoacid:ferredoxin oxidoreductase subunit gamma [Deferribacter autotrophicus]